MELKEGMYVRTNKGTIDKLDDKNIMMYQVSLMGFGEKPIKARYNIAELLEVGDFLDNHYIDEIEDRTIYFSDGWFIDFDDVEDLVSTIATKEQFESMSYKVGE